MRATNIAIAFLHRAPPHFDQVSFSLPPSPSPKRRIDRLSVAPESVGQDGANGEHPVDRSDSDPDFVRFGRNKRYRDFPLFAYERYPRFRKFGGESVIDSVDPINDTNENASTRKDSQSDPNDARDWLSGAFDPHLWEINPSKRKTSLIESRAYARRGAFTQKNAGRPPTIEDLAPPPTKKYGMFWAGRTSRFITLGASFVSFPYLLRFLDLFTDVSPDQFEKISSTFVPGISVLYGTFISLTLSILYTRQQSIQELGKLMMQGVD